MDDVHFGKKRRLPGACDNCRQRKVRCDSALMPGSVCSPCLVGDIKCTHLMSKNSGDSGSPQVAEYDSDPEPSLPIFRKYREARIIVSSLLSPTDQYKTVAKDYATLRSHSVELARYIAALEKQLIFLTPDSNSSCPSSDTQATHSQKPVQPEEAAVVDLLQSLSLEQERPRFYGRSSNLALVQAVIEARNDLGDGDLTFAPRRMEYWKAHPWEVTSETQHPPLIFPDLDLLHHLLDLAFENCNSFFFLFHRPTFDRLIIQGKHLVHREFGMTVLVMCAIAARYSNDPRVFYTTNAGLDTNTSHGGLSNGWQYFRQVSLNQSSTKPTSIYELQLYCAYLLYMTGTAMPEACWIALGTALRLAVDIGLHKKKPGKTRRTVESELWIRAFWVLISVDIIMSTSTGRPRGLNSEEYDQDMPAECDDEYWETSEPFKQPPGKPSRVSFWIWYLKLMHIVAYTQRTVYSTSTNHPWLNISPPKDNDVVVQIDSALNQWLDSIPEHLRWDPHRQDTFFLDQSAVLYTSYYYAQILLHKPFIPSPNNNNRLVQSTSFPSLAICANAARSCCHALDIESRRSFLPLPHVMTSLFASALILLLNHWSGRRRGFPSNPGREYADVYKCIGILQLYEGRWQVVGRFRDVLDQLLEGKHDDLPSVQRFQSDQTYDLPTLPFHTEELGRLPVYGSFNLSDAEWWQQYAPFSELPNAGPGSMAATNHIQQSDLMAYIELDRARRLTNPTPNPLSQTAVMAETVALLTQTEGYSWDDWMSAPDQRNILR
ncbi:fungal-specific transcription factor domain-containing protein [Mycena floridula]|nr:fungal-specific transcription factor domain-containing protein [Mycena floridula]